MTAMRLKRYPSPSGGFALGKMGVGATMLKQGKTARDYVQSGLVAMWDGIENAGWGTHDPNATKWRELISDTLSNTLDPHFTWGPNYLSTAGGTAGSNGLSPTGAFTSFSPGSEYTVEVVFKDYVSSSVRNLFQLSSSHIIGLDTYMRSGYEQIAARFNGNVYYYFAEDYASVMTGSHAVVLACDGTTPYLYIDGQYCAKKGGGGIGSFTPGATLPYFAWDNPTTHSEKYCRLSVYSRALTTSEITRNYAIDQERFNLP